MNIPTRSVLSATSLSPGDVIVKALNGKLRIPHGMVVTMVERDTEPGCGYAIHGKQAGKDLVLTPVEGDDVFDVLA